MNPSVIQQPMLSFGKSISYSSLTTFILSFFWLFLCGTFVFDIIHYFFHKFSKSRSRFLRLIGKLHEVHHYYFHRRLQFNNHYLWHNICFELPLELACQAFGSWLGWLFLERIVVLSGAVSEHVFHAVLAVEVAKVVVVAILCGRDSNHKTYNTVPKNPHTFIVGPEYHALHHVDPAAYMGSTLYLFDWLFGTAYTLKSRRITLTGASGAFGKAMIRELQAESVACIQQLKFGVDWTYNNYEAAIPILANTDILILAHGSKGQDALKANCESTVQLISLFKNYRKSDPAQIDLLPEIWYVGSKHILLLSEPFFRMHGNYMMITQFSIAILSRPHSNQLWVQQSSQRNGQLEQQCGGFEGVQDLLLLRIRGLHICTMSNLCFLLENCD
jgi:hypothetical protein